jgi:mono/diheme cytochrome c family protein
VRRSHLLPLLVGAAIAIVVLVLLGAFVFIKSGIYNVAASKPHTKFTFYVTNETMIHSVKRHAKGIEAPASAGAGQVVRGFCAYETHCVACHGAAAVARQQWTGGMEPQPPYLLDATHKFTPAELFWIVKNGIKMTGMPSWRDELSDAEIWNTVAFLEAMPKMNAQDYRRWRSASLCPRLTPSPSPGSSAIPHRAPPTPTGATGESAPSSPVPARP